MSLSYSYSELLSCSWMLKQKRIFYSHTHAWMCPLNHTIITLTCRQAHHSSCPLSLQPLSAQHFLCPALSPLRLAPSPFRATSHFRSASTHCRSVIVVHGILIYRLWVVVIYCIGIYYFIVLFIILDVGCIVKWVVKINKNVYFLKTLLVNALKPQIVILKQSFLHVYIIKLKNNHLGKGKILAQDMVSREFGVYAEGRIVTYLK